MEGKETYVEIIDLIHAIDTRTAVMSSTLESVKVEQEQVKSSMRDRMSDLELRIRSLETWRIYTVAIAAVGYWILDSALPLVLGVIDNG